MGTTLWFYRFEDGAPATTARAEVVAILRAHGIDVVGDTLRVPDTLAGDSSWDVETGDVREIALERVVFGPALDALGAALTSSGLTAIGSWGEAVVPPSQTEQAPLLDARCVGSWDELER